jgi:hypothetical protein
MGLTSERLTNGQNTQQALEEPGCHSGSRDENGRRNCCRLYLAGDSFWLLVRDDSRREHLLCRVLLQKMLRHGKPIGKHKVNHGVLCLRLMPSVKKSLLTVIRLPRISKRGSILSKE